MEPERLTIGTVIKAHGIRGEVVVDVLSDHPGRFSPGAVIDGDGRSLTVRTARAHQGRLLVSFEGIGDRTGAEGLRGVALTVPGVEARPLPEGSWYPWQLEGLEVVDRDGVVLGRWLRAEENAANDVWVIDAGGREVLVPAVKDLVHSVDLDAGRIVIDAIPGLFG